MSYSASVTSYISETAHPTIRGSLVTLRALSMATGLLTTWTLGYFVTWRMIAYILTIPPILLFLFLLLLPETPYWLVEHDKVIDARKSLQFFRGQKYDITDEFNEIQQKHESKKCQYTKNSWSFTIKRMFSPAFLKPFSCVGILYMINSWLGFSPLMTFSFEILEKAGSNIDPGIGLIIIGSIRVLFAGMNKICISNQTDKIVQYLFSGMAPFIIHRFQPKILFVLATLSTSFSMALIGIFVFLQEHYSSLAYLNTFSWIPLVSFMIAVIARSIGILPVLHSLLSEVFPTEIRTQSIGLVQAANLAMGTVCIKFFPEMKKIMTFHGLFFFYGASGIVSCLWGLKTIQDNREKSLIKVEEMYEKKGGS